MLSDSAIFYAISNFTNCGLFDFIPKNKRVFSELTFNIKIRATLNAYKKLYLFKDLFDFSYL